jgi:plasmid maintenance system killer protein
VEDLEIRGLTKQYKKAKDAILQWFPGGADFKQRQPVKSGVWSFRINKQFRAIGHFNSSNELIISYIDNHQ